MNNILRYHVSGAIERGEAEAIEEHPVECPGCGEEWNDCICPEIDCEPEEDTESLENCDDWGTGEGRWHGRM